MMALGPSLARIHVDSLYNCALKCMIELGQHSYEAILA
jgi:hypothetical protein